MQSDLIEVTNKLKIAKMETSLFAKNKKTLNATVQYFCWAIFERKELDTSFFQEIRNGVCR